jgi:hypothetical protein
MVIEMAVHVGELHTDVRSGEEPGQSHQEGSGKPGGGQNADQRWRESRGRTEWLARRVAAEGFDD